MSRRHIRRTTDGPGFWSSQCWKRFPDPPRGSSPEILTRYKNPQDSDCLQCLERLRDSEAWDLTRSARNVVRLTQALEAERRKRRRKTRHGSNSE